VYQVISFEDNRIEIVLRGDLNADEFRQIVHQLESLCAAHPKIRVLFDATELNRYDFSIALQEFDFYKRYRGRVERIALVSDNAFRQFVVKLLDGFVDTELEAYPLKERAEARDWVWR
jgi:anti-anti-sigma regulatory factor